MTYQAWARIFNGSILTGDGTRGDVARGIREFVAIRFG